MSFSPQRAHRIPDNGTTRCKHESQTGRAEIAVSGDWQRRQSEGNKTENRLSAADLIVRCARFRSPLLLKTASFEEPCRVAGVSIAALRNWMQSKTLGKNLGLL